MPVHHVDTTGTAVALPGHPATPGSALWAEVRPDLRRSAVIAGDILAALGKRRDVAGIGRNQNEDIALAIAWMDAYDINALVLTEAQNLTPLLMRQVVNLAKAAGVPLWLLHRAPRTDRFVHDLELRQTHPRPLDEVPPPTTWQAAPGKRPTLNVTLPNVGFHQFLTSCRITLGPKANERVQLRHASTAVRCHDTLQRDGTGADVIARLVEGILRTAPQDDLLITDLRALQLAAWHNDVYLKSDVPQLLASSERQLTDPDTVDQTLIAYRQPHRAVAVTLAARQVGVRDIQALEVKDASSDGKRLRLHSGEVVVFPEHAGRALRALVKLRTDRATDPTASLLAVPERAVSQALNDASTDLNIRVHGRRAERHVHPQRWLRKLGLTPYVLA